jgi:hypothetical protein
MKLFIYFLVIIGSILTTSATKSKGRKLIGNYAWQYTLTENESMLIKQNNYEEKFNPSVYFSSNYTFNDTRTAKCGNDIIYNKKGRYYFSSKQLVMNYTGGNFEDNVGGNSRQVYVLGRVYFKVNKWNSDTIFLTKIKGDSEKKVSLLETK